MGQSFLTMMPAANICSNCCYPYRSAPNPEIKMTYAVEVWCDRWPEPSMKDAAAIVEQINLMPVYERKPTARVLGDRLRVTYGERERLRLWTIAPCDVGARGMALLRRQKDKDRKRRRRKLQSRANYEATSANRIKPWLAQGISRRTYYYRLKASGCTSLSAVKLTNNNGHTCAIAAASSQQERESPSR